MAVVNWDEVAVVLHFVQPVGACGHLVRFDGQRKRVQHSVGKKFRQSIDVLDLTGIAHVPTVRTLRQFMP